jgi:predicted PhzF superfamily epimerase YddE/YHI9
MKYTFHIVDVFSSTPFGGNQLAVLPDAVGTAYVASGEIEVPPSALVS